MRSTLKSCPPPNLPRAPRKFIKRSSGSSENSHPQKLNPPNLRPKAFCPADYSRKNPKRKRWGVWPCLAGNAWRFSGWTFFIFDHRGRRDHGNHRGSLFTRLFRVAFADKNLNGFDAGQHLRRVFAGKNARNALSLEQIAGEISLHHRSGAGKDSDSRQLGVLVFLCTFLEVLRWKSWL